MRKREMLGEHQPQEQREDEHAEHVAGDQTEENRRAEIEHGADRDGVPVLPAENRVFPQIGDVRGVVVLRALDHHPAHVRVEEPFLGVVGIVVGVDVAVVKTMGCRPRDDAVFISRRADDRKHRSHRRRRRPGAVGEQPVVSGGDAEAGQQPHRDTRNDLDPRHPVREDVPRDRDDHGQRQQREKRHVAPDDGATLRCGWARTRFPVKWMSCRDAPVVVSPVCDPVAPTLPRGRPQTAPHPDESRGGGAGGVQLWGSRPGCQVGGGRRSILDQPTRHAGRVPDNPPRDNREQL